jgi:hypothetical protein
LFDIYFAPNRAFARQKDKPVWLVPLIIALVFNMLIALLSAQYVDWDKQKQFAMDRMRAQNMTEEQVQQATGRMDKFYSNPIMRYGMPPVSALFISLIGVFFLAIVYNVSLPLLGGTSDFMRALAVVCNAGLVAVPSAIVRAGLVLLKRSSEVTTSLLLAAPGLKPGFLTVVLSRVDVFAIWQLILCALGLSVVFNLKGAKSYVLVFAVWAVLTLVFALLGGRAGR